MTQPINIFWFRRDLRIDDNHGLYKALTETNPVIPIFIFDTDILNLLSPNDARVSFIYRQIKQLQKK